MEPREERRRFTRVFASLEVSLATARSERVSGMLTDLSVVGLCMLTKEDVPVGARCRVHLQADGESIEVRGVVVRREGTCLGVRFDEVPYAEYERLRQLLLSHAAEPLAVDEELSDRLGFLEET